MLELFSLSRLTLGGIFLTYFSSNTSVRYTELRGHDEKSRLKRCNQMKTSNESYSLIFGLQISGLFKMLIVIVSLSECVVGV